LGEIVGPVDHVEEHEGDWEQNSGDDVDHLGPELNVAEVVEEAVVATMNGDFRLEESAWRNHGGSFDSPHQGVLQNKATKMGMEIPRKIHYLFWAIADAL
jgi:hypothetical protein